MIRIIIGKTFSGKTTLLKQMQEYTPAVWLTTRPIRKGEIDGVDYYFKNEIGFHEEARNGCIVEQYDVYQDGMKTVWKYGLTLDALTGAKTSVIIDIDKLVKLTDMLLFNEVEFEILYVNTPEEEILRRIVDSDRSGEELLETMRRLLDDTRKYIDIEEKLDKWGLSQYTIKYIEDNEEKNND